MRILIYEAMPDILRADVILGIAAKYLELGHSVFLLLDEEVHLTTRNQIKSPHIVNCLNVIKAKIACKKIPFFVTPGLDSLNQEFYSKPNEETLTRIYNYKCSFYQTILDQFRPERIVIWNGLMNYQQAFIQLSRQRNPEQQFRFLEAAWFPQKGNYYEDPLGVNAASSIALTKPAKLNQDQEQEINEWKAQYRLSQGNHPIKDKGYLLVPLQLESDSNISKFSPIKTMKALLQWLVENTEKNIPIVARPHPLSGTNHEHLQALSPRVQIDSQTPLHKLIAEAKAVAGVNSTVLLESLIYEKPTIALGNGLFQNSEAIYLQELSATMPEVLGGEFKRVERQNALLYLLKSRQKPIPTNVRRAHCLASVDGVPVTTYPATAQISSRIKIKLKLFCNKLYTLLT